MLKMNLGCKEHFESGWVSYEWTSFLNEIKSERKKDSELFVVYQGLKIGQLPYELRHKECFDAQDKTSIERLNNFIISIKKRSKTSPKPNSDNYSGQNSSGNSNIVSCERFLSGFSSISSAGISNINIHPNKNYKVLVTTDNNIQEFIETKVTGSNLTINTKSNTSLSITELTIDVYLPELQRVTISGSGNVIIGSGKGSTLDINLSGSGNIDAKDFQVHNTQVTMSGSGIVRVWAIDSLNAKVSGSGNLIYQGNPSVISTSITGSATIKKCISAIP